LFSLVAFLSNNFGTFRFFNTQRTILRDSFSSKIANFLEILRFVIARKFAPFVLSAIFAWLAAGLQLAWEGEADSFASLFLRQG
jgi:hypothetical protein